MFHANDELTTIFDKVKSINKISEYLFLLNLFQSLIFISRNIKTGIRNDGKGFLNELFYTRYQSLEKLNK
jgi:hypothetical protein